MLGLVVRGGRVAGHPSPQALLRHLVRATVPLLEEAEVLGCDREFGVRLLQEEGDARYGVRLPKHFTARRASPPPYQQRGRPPTRGKIVRPLPRQRAGRFYPATSPDELVFWTEGRQTLRAEVWRDLVLPDAPAGSPTFSVLAIHRATVTRSCWPRPSHSRPPARWRSSLDYSRKPSDGFGAPSDPIGL